jgi:hypothetical protein
MDSLSRIANISVRNRRGSRGVSALWPHNCGMQAARQEHHMAKKYQLPKRLLGVKIPKALRNLDWATRFLESEVGRQILADALVAAAAAASAALVGTQTEVGAKAGKKLSKAKNKGAHFLSNAVNDATNAVTDVIGNAARSMLAKDEEDGGVRQRRTAH